MNIEYTTAARLQAEIERLRVDYAEIATRARQAAIEECAKVADSFSAMHRPMEGHIGIIVHPSRVAAAIRALKDES